MAVGYPQLPRRVSSTPAIHRGVWLAPSVAYPGVIQTGGYWTSRGDDAGQIHISGGVADLNGTRDAILQTYGVYQTGGSIKATNSQIDAPLNITARLRIMGETIPAQVRTLVSSPAT